MMVMVSFYLFNALQEGEEAYLPQLVPSCRCYGAKVGIELRMTLKSICNDSSVIKPGRWNGLKRPYCTVELYHYSCVSRTPAADAEDEISRPVT